MKLRNRGTAGFTLMEVIIAVAIIVILAGLIGVNVMSYQRGLYFLEQESVAKEIFVAAQNHLTLADSQGLLSQNTYNTGTENDADRDIFYFVHAPGSTLPGSSVLGLMLPEYSLDATVRISGSYIIRYQRSTAQVVDVFYASPQGSTFGGRYGYTLTDEDVTTYSLFSQYTGDANKDKRLKYPEGTGDYVIGWYGASAGDISKGSALQAPEVIIRNAERLTVTVNNPNVEENGSKATAQLKLVVTGKESKAVKVFELIDKSYAIPTGKDYLPTAQIDKRTFTLVFDDITSSKHFAAVFQNADSGTFIPGEDLRIEAVAFDNSKLVRIAKSGEQTTNSLFASLKVDRTTQANGSSTINASTARISSIRHLENLDGRISNVENDALKLDGAEQLGNIYWTDGSWSGDTTVYATAKEFAESLKGFKESILAQGYLMANAVPTIDGVKSALVGEMEITNVGGGSAAAGKNLYVPVYPSRALNYKGKLHFVANARVSTSGDAGLFAELKSGSKVENLELRDFNIVSTTANVGVLAGSATSTAISGVLARNTRANDSSLTNVGATSAGGIVGKMEGGSITLSAAAVRVTSTSGDAGGLVGKTTGSESVTISNSYGGGHTKNGTYYAEVGGTLRPIYNIQAANGNAGGLVGDAANATITNCYSTCSAQGKTSAGGLVGAISAGSVKKSYATGLVGAVDATGVVGCFVGTLDSSVTLGTDAEANSYFSIVNLYDADGATRTVSAIGINSSNTAVSAFDTTAATYNGFAKGTSAAYPYDTYLVSKGASTYPLQNIEALSGVASSGLPKHAIMHFGDWPMPEVLVVNTK